MAQPQASSWRLSGRVRPIPSPNRPYPSPTVHPLAPLHHRNWPCSHPSMGMKRAQHRLGTLNQRTYEHPARRDGRPADPLAPPQTPPARAPCRRDADPRFHVKHGALHAAARSGDSPIRATSPQSCPHPVGKSPDQRGCSASISNEPEDALQIVRVGEVDHDPPPLATRRNSHARIEHRRQRLLDLQ